MSFTSTRLREWTSLLVAIGIGPAFLVVGDHIPGLVFGAAAVAISVLFVLIVPLLTIAARRFKFLAWQLAIISTTTAILVDNLRLNSIHRREILDVAFVFWGWGTLLSSPVPIYFLLKGRPVRQRYIATIGIAVIAVALWLGIWKITR